MWKIIVLTASMTAVVLVAAMGLFFKPVLAHFGMAATSIGHLAALQASHQAVEKMKERHIKKKAHTRKRFGKRAGRRVASTTLAAITVGASGVAIAVGALEIADYCEEKGDLVKDANILYGRQDEFDLKYCAEEAKHDVEAMWSEAHGSTDAAVDRAVEKAAKYARENWESLKSAIGEVSQPTAEMLNNLWN